jgi:hypothetical protein
MRTKPLELSLFAIAVAALCCGCGDDESNGWNTASQQDSGSDGSRADGGNDSGPGVDGSKDAPADQGAKDAGPQDGPAADVTEAGPPIDFSFVAFADNQFATTSCTSGVPERLAVPLAIVKLAPTFVIEAGDLMDHGYEDGAYAKLVSCYDAMLTKLPYFPVVGNHDCGSGGILKFRSFLENQLTTRNKAVWGAGYESAFEIKYGDDPNTYSTDPSNPGSTADVPSGFSFKTFYAFKHKNAYFVGFEQGTRWWSDTPRSWVEKHLKAARADPDIRHLFVYMHHPMYSSTMAESDASGECIGPVRKYYEALFRQYDVTMVFSGHAHVYDRFYVPDDGSATRSDPPKTTYAHDGKAIHYIVTGGGGGPLPTCPTGEKHEFSYDFGQARGCGYHVTHVKVHDAALAVEIVGVTGSETSYTTKVWDSFTVQ